MPNITMLDKKGKKLEEISLADEVFGLEPNVHVMHEMVLSFLANQRQGTQSTKTRTERRGGGRKPWRQKGTGRARQGSTRSPQWKKGGIALGPKPRDYSYSLNKKTRQLAMKSALSSKVIDENFVIIDKFDMDAYKTKEMLEILANIGADEKALIVLSDRDNFVIKSAANIPWVKTTGVNTLNVYDIINYDKFIITPDAVKVLEEVYV